jgi:hypothetical protein
MADKLLKDQNGNSFYVRPDGTMYRLDSPNIDTVNERNIDGKELQRIKDYINNQLKKFFKSRFICYDK